MKEIGTKLKEKREENGVSVEEVSEDLKVRPRQIISLEEGKKDDFKDILFLKYFIRDYAKYLGLDENELVDEFNEFLFVIIDSPRFFSISSFATFAACPPSLAIFLFSSNP